MVIRLETGPCLMSGSSVMLSIFSVSLLTLLVIICGFNPMPKFAVHTQALTIVRTIRTIVIAAKLVKLFRTGI